MNGEGWCENQSCSVCGKHKQIEVSVQDKKDDTTFIVLCSVCGKGLTGWVTGKLEGLER